MAFELTQYYSYGSRREERTPISVMWESQILLILEKKYRWLWKLFGEGVGTTMTLK
jgi:hypothetical protein